jgi:hypothetical protein
MACVYGFLRFPQGTTEPEAIEIAKETAQKKGTNCCIRIHPLRVIWISPGREPTAEAKVTTTTFRPEIRWDHRFIHFSGAQEDIGTVRLR